ncbi:hypothetical protein GF339_18350 [candidate division KSB3 bacterium]|uniref:Uncharacterized protein n=1 Tax=candidate division KSB3 bacterium TaxID=2044937 RepID=A0A9D5JYD0_9BACT|nr:hypothetical protein [candidate division KSB3 bacterium]MBD3326552.1 hypothetical protein [candidate division KSB3 bacterium]
MWKTISDPAPEATWDLWYHDSFDAACPRRIEVSGKGLLTGLTELWSRYLRETVQSNGREGFSRFNLWWQQERRSITIVGDLTGAVHLKTWVFSTPKGNRGLLHAIALAHCHLILAGRTSAPLLDAASLAADEQEFQFHMLQ